MTVKDFLKKKILKAPGDALTEAQRPLSASEQAANPMNAVSGAQTIIDYQKKQRKILDELGRS